MKDKASMNEPVIESKRTRKKFDNAFKQRAVELWLSSGRTATEVAAELGFNAQRLSAWRGRWGAAPPSAAPSNWKPKIPVCGARSIISASNEIF
jgi:transposase-like protein